jgi:hypothetical protein
LARSLAALRPLTVAGRALLLARVDLADGGSVLELYEAGSGQRLDRLLLSNRYGHDPDRYLDLDTWDEELVAVTKGRTDEYVVVSVREAGFRSRHQLDTGVEWVADLATGRVDGRPAVLTTDHKRVLAHDQDTPDGVGLAWAPPDGWEVEALVRAGPVTVAWLGPVRPSPPPGITVDELVRSWPSADWRCWPWDAVARAPLVEPFALPGYRWEPWDLAGRPVVLVKLDWRRYQVWDLLRREPVGPPLPADLDKLTAPAVGTLHGRAVLAAGVAASLGCGTWPAASRSGPGRRGPRWSGPRSGRPTPSTC